MANAVYQDPTRVVAITIPAAQNNSDIVDLTKTDTLLGSPKGAAQLRRLNFPADWTTSNITFEVFDDNIGTNPRLLNFFDLVTVAPIKMLAVAPSTTISLSAPGFDTIFFFRLVSETAQVNEVEVTAIATPIYVVPA